MVQKKGWDAAVLIDGIEGSGKSTLGLTCAYYLSDGKFELKDICTGSNDAIAKLDQVKEGGVLLIDEGSLLFSSSDAMRREQKQLIMILNVIRQKRIALIIVSPSFFRLNRYIAVDRTRFLIHVYTKEDLKRGRFTYFGQKKKNKLYELGKRNFNSYAKPRANWNGTFADFNPFGEEYAKVKKQSLREALNPEKKALEPKKIQQLAKIKMIQTITPNLPIKNKSELAKAMEIDRSSFYKYLNTREIAEIEV
jgi:DNA invertase Pin-like site-specific DNA recombinase